MRVLTIFLDMIRANRLSTFNDKVEDDTPIDVVLKELGGTVYNNCFTPGADTPRGISAYLTGIDPNKNGCNTRLKWPAHFIYGGTSNVFDLFNSMGYKNHVYASIKEQETGLFPFELMNTCTFNKNHKIDDFLSNITLENNHHLFVGVSDFHWAFDDFGYTRKGESQSYDIVSQVVSKIFDKFEKNDFDHIFIFSDHGFKFTSESYKADRRLLLNEDRTNVLMFHHIKGDKGLLTNNKLCSLSDMYATYQDILGVSPKRDYSLLVPEQREYILSEEHANFLPSVNQNIEMWSLVNNNHIYIRTLTSSMLINRVDRSITEDMIGEYDELIKHGTSFGDYLDEYNKIFNYTMNIRNGYACFSDGSPRKRRSRYSVIKDVIFDKISSIKS